MVGDPFSGEVRDGELHGRGACDMKGGIAAILGRGPGARSDRRAGPAAGRAGRRAGPVRGGRRPGDARRDPGRRDRRPVRDPRAVVARRRRSPTPARSRSGSPSRAARPTRAVGSRACRRSTTWATSSGRSRPTRRAATPDETDPLMTALGMPYPTIVGTVAGGEWASTVMDRVVAEGRYGVRLGQAPDEAEAELRACIAAACAAHPFLRDHPATVEITGARFASSRVAGGPCVAGVAGGGRPGGDGPAAVAGRGPVRRGHAAVHRRRRHAVRDLRARGRQAGPRRGRAGAARRGRGVRPGARGVGRRGARAPERRDRAADRAAAAGAAGGGRRRRDGGGAR